MDTTRKQPNYVMVWAALAVLTVVEVLVAFVTSIPKEMLILVLLGLAVWKAVLVAMYYMHLKFEPLRLALMAAAPLPLAVILVVAVLTEKF